MNSSPHFVHLKAYFKWSLQILILWIYVDKETSGFFNTEMTVSVLISKTLEMSRMPLPFRDIFIINFFISGFAALFAYAS